MKILKTSLALIALFEKGRSTITEHLKNIFAEGELDEQVVCRDFRHTTLHGAIREKFYPQIRQMFAD